jgi:hypothetical protein
MDAAERKRIIGESWETLEGLERRAAEAAREPPRDPEAEDALARWTRRRPPPAPPRRPPEPSADELAQLRTEQWDSWVRSYLNDERALMTEAIGEALATIRQQLRRELAAEVEKLRAELNVVRSISEGDVVDLPPLLRRRHDPT